MSTRRALVLVDLQNDFCEGGALGIQGGDEVARRATQLLSEAVDDFAAVVVSQDWHDPDSDNGGHIALTASPDFVDTWPPHCIAGTSGAELADDLEQALARLEGLPVLRIRKGQGVPAYSAFEGTADDGSALAPLLRSWQVGQVDVLGLAFDHCVRATALDAAKAGFEVRVLKDCTAAVDPTGESTVAAGMIDAGVQITESALD